MFAKEDGKSRFYDCMSECMLKLIQVQNNKCIKHEKKDGRPMLVLCE